MAAEVQYEILKNVKPRPVTVGFTSSTATTEITLVSAVAGHTIRVFSLVVVCENTSGTAAAILSFKDGAGGFTRLRLRAGINAIINVPISYGNDPWQLSAGSALVVQVTGSTSFTVDVQVQYTRHP